MNGVDMRLPPTIVELADRGEYQPRSRSPSAWLEPADGRPQQAQAAVRRVAGDLP